MLQTKYNNESIITALFLVFIGLAVCQPVSGLYKGVFYLAIIPASYRILKDAFHNTYAGLRTLAPFLLLLLFILVSVAWSEASGGDKLTVAGKMIRTTLFFITCFALGRSIEKSQIDFSRILFCLIVAGTTISIIYYLFYTPGAVRISGISKLLQNPIQGGSIFLVLFFVALATARQSSQILLGIAGTCTLIYVILSGSRSVIITMLIGCAVILLSKIDNLRKWYPYLAVGILISAIAVVFIYVETPVIHQLLHRNVYRLDMWNAVISNLDDHWLLGMGQATLFSDTAAGASAAEMTGLHLVAHPHSLYFSLLFHTGIIGLLLFFYAITTLVIRTRKNFYYLLLIAIVLLLCLTDNPYLINREKEIWFIFWIPVGLIYGVLAAREEERNRSDNNQMSPL